MDDAIAAQQEAARLVPNDHLIWSSLGDALWHGERQDEARAAFLTAERFALEALEVNPNDAYTTMDLAWISAMLDKPEVARQLIDSARSLAPEDPQVHYIDGLIWLKADEPDKALDALAMAARAGFAMQLMAAEPHLAGLRDHPGFRFVLNAGGGG